MARRCPSRRWLLIGARSLSLVGVVSSVVATVVLGCRVQGAESPFGEILICPSVGAMDGTRLAG